MRRLLPLVFLLSCTPVDDGSGDGGEVSAPAVCDDYCDTVLACHPDLDETDPEQLDACVKQCALDFQLAAAQDKMVCPMLLDATYQCVSVLTCDDYNEFRAPTGDTYPCQSQESEFCLACPASCG